MTAANFSMYSNLRVDELRSNHLVLPRLFRGLGYQDDVAEIVDSSNSEIRDRTALKQSGWSRRDLLLPYFELRRLVSQRAQSGFWIEFRRDGELSRVSYDANPDHELFRPPSPLLGKLLLFRPVSPRGQPQPCLW